MSRRFSRRVAPCTKRVYRSKEEAEATMDMLRQRPGRRKYEERAYLCSRCNRWHLTSQEAYVPA